MAPRVVRFVGLKGSGKTYAITKVAQKLIEYDMKVAVVKSLGEHDINIPGTDTYKFMQIVDHVVAVGRYSIAYITKLKEKLLPVIVKSIPYTVDIILVEGFKGDTNSPKVICARNLNEVKKLSDGFEIAIVGPIASKANKILQRSMDKPIINVDNPNELESLVKLIIEKSFILPGINCKKCGLSCSELAKKIVKGEESINKCIYRAKREKKVKVVIDNVQLELNPFIEEMIKSTIRGLLRPLKGYREGRITIEIY